ncbi:hypothetical protein SEPCBS119000_005559 [Sporothrix epigloea]|uniref:Uncharacterized protein n=1 Tax=Sporothrix epigloea TaxID=1892477 RepID=A0ABP0DZF3_9PEZI
MSSADEITSLAGQAKNFASVNDRQLMNFLSLAPATSSSYPQKQASVPETSAAAETVVAVDPKQRRSSSTSSTGSNSTSPGLRILKLGPVHWGEHLDEHKQDWHEVVIE